MQTNNELVSFRDWKINYNEKLGEGVFGVVYDLVERPEREKGILSSLFPFIYDYIFRLDNKQESETHYCVKVFKSALRIFLQYDLISTVKSFKEQMENRKSNEIAYKYHLTNVKFYPTASCFAQFKTKINGFTFAYWHHEKLYYQNDHFKLRKGFAEFLVLIGDAKISFSDLHAHNIMYDAIAERWVVVDGDIKEAQENNPENIIKLIVSVGPMWMDDRTVCFFKKLSKVATKRKIYSEITDQKLVNKITQIQEGARVVL